jgi:hypothetical protein
VNARDRIGWLCSFSFFTPPFDALGKTRGYQEGLETFYEVAMASLAQWHMCAHSLDSDWTSLS